MHSHTEWGDSKFQAEKITMLLTKAMLRLLVICGLMAISASTIFVAPAVAADEVVILRSRWTNLLLLRTPTGTLQMGVPGPYLNNAKWLRRPVPGTEYYRLCSVDSPDSCINNGTKLELGQVAADSQSGMWKFPAVNDKDYIRIQNRLRPLEYLNIETGQQPGVSAIQNGWWSAQWAVDKEFVNDARSVHLKYETAGEVTTFYNEVQITETHPSSYFMVIGFSGGYFGIQDLGNNKGQVIFSLWDDTDEKKRTQVPLSSQARSLRTGTNVAAAPFDGEGVGISARLPYDWRQGDKFQFYIDTEIKGDRTIYKAYFAKPVQGYLSNWQFIAEMDRPANGVRLNKLYSFVEDFSRNGAVIGVAAAKRSPYQRRSAVFRNGWTRPWNAGWYPVTKATFTAWSPQPLDNINAQVEKVPNGIGFGLETGGSTLQSTPLDTLLISTDKPSAFPDIPR
jgi:hypothetical protein